MRHVMSPADNCACHAHAKITKSSSRQVLDGELLEVPSNVRLRTATSYDLAIS